MKPRLIPDYNDDLLNLKTVGSLVKNEDLVKMNDSEWARYMLESLYLLWFQSFCATLPIYSGHSQGLIDFARKLLNHITAKLKPMRELETIYRRLFQACGNCKQINELIELNRDLQKNKIQPDKVTSGTYHQALVQCKRQGGKVEDKHDKKKSYFTSKMEDYQDKLNE